MEFFLKYIRSHLVTIAVFLLCISISAAVMFLYGTPVAVIAYSVILCLAAGLIFGGLCLYSGWKRNKKLHIMRKLPSDMVEALTAYKGIDDENYRMIISLLEEQREKMNADLNARYYDMIDYYTVWVHQIKTPIASMRLLLQSEDSPVARQLQEDLLRIEQYVEMVLTYLRLDSDSTDYLFSEVEIDDVIRQSIRKLSGQFITRGLKLIYEPINKKVVTDEKWLGFVIEQIISNALKYTPSGSITIEWTEPDAVSIKDTGMGIASEDLPRIFEKGYTGYHGREDKKASGLGLYLCKRICDNLGHSISVTSRPEEGSVFTVHLTKM
ncbi:MAG: sensor histidine kinase [Emergencia sp.]